VRCTFPIESQAKDETSSPKHPSKLSFSQRNTTGMSLMVGPMCPTKHRKGAPSSFAGTSSLKHAWTILCPGDAIGYTIPDKNRVPRSRIIQFHEDIIRWILRGSLYLPFGRDCSVVYTVSVMALCAQRAIAIMMREQDVVFHEVSKDTKPEIKQLSIASDSGCWIPCDHSFSLY
jgi:hypothetical protein